MLAEDDIAALIEAYYAADINCFSFDPKVLHLEKSTDSLKFGHSNCAAHTVRFY